ncbi:hypothetical protein [Desertivirga brevis]|uniref:hypothetical protein n=1 Tax=Desertivirga brevis TaxID=2810310 RepID=UPI001A96F74A|nr:hypothetical protein [Pedobacter sp. SYSU D00873]
MRVVLLLLSLIFAGSAGAYDLQGIRVEFYKAVNDASTANSLYKKLKGIEKKDALLLAYLGSTEAVKAKHAFNPYNKLSLLKSGSKKLEQAVGEEPASLEIRFLRFSLEHYLPAFLGASKHLDEDRKQIVKLIGAEKFGSVDKALLKNIIAFMKETKRCSSSELTVLNKAL